MKNILSSLTNNEKNRILEMHKSATKKAYLSEQTVTGVTPTAGVKPTMEPLSLAKLKVFGRDLELMDGSNVINFTVKYSNVKDNPDKKLIKIIGQNDPNFSFTFNCLALLFKKY